MNSKKMFLSLIPWVIFTLIVQTAGPTAAGMAACAAMAIAMAFAVMNRRGGVKIIDLTGIVTFGLMGGLAVWGGPPAQQLVAHFGRAGSAMILAVVMLISAVTVPFTEAYARESVPEQYWRSPRFRAVNRRISAIWGAIIAVIAVSHVVYGVMASMSPDGVAPRPGDVILNWAIPIGLIYLGVNLTKKAADGQTSSVAASSANPH